MTDRSGHGHTCDHVTIFSEEKLKLLYRYVKPRERTDFS